jgi:tRNA (mo5U34)-methyltransferase
MENTEEHVWYHTIDLPDGTSTPGWYDTRDALKHIEWPAALHGGRCLDVGTFDGFWGFQMERRGAREVVALDVDDPTALDWSYDHRLMGPQAVLEWKSNRGPGFADAAALIGSKVKRVNLSVYDLDPEKMGTFDVVLCGALLLHLRNPMEALERMREVCRGELLLVETLDPLMDLVARRSPAATLAPDWDQWWRVNSAGLRRLVELAGFDLIWTSKRFLVPFGPGAPASLNMGRLGPIAALKPRGRGQLHQALRARPREPRPDR